MIKFNFISIVSVLFCLIIVSCSKKIAKAEIMQQPTVKKDLPKNNEYETLQNESNPPYAEKKSPIKGYNNAKEDGVAVIKKGDNFAILQPGDSYKFSWFKKGNENDDVTLQRAIDFIYYTRLEGKDVMSGKSLGNYELISTSGTLVLDQSITLKKTVEIYENITLKGDFVATTGHSFTSSTIFIDLKEQNTSAIKFRRFPKAPMNYVGGKLDGIQFSAISPCKSAVDLEGATGIAMKDVKISGNNLMEIGIEISNAIFLKLINIRIEEVNNVGLHVKKTNESISTTTEIEHLSVSGGKHGVFVEYKSCNSLYIKNCTIEETKNSAIKIEQYNTVHIDNLYTENVLNDSNSTGNIAIIDVNTNNYGNNNGNKGMVTITNSFITGYRTSYKKRKVIGIYADNLDMINISGCKFNLVDQSIIMKSGCNSVNWFNNNECGGMNVYNALNTGNPKENGIDNPNAFNVFSSYSSASGKYEPYTRIVSQKSRLYTPILLSRGNNRLRIAEEGIDELKHFTEMWVQYGQQPGELRVAPGGKNVAATFGTNGGVTIGNELTFAPPKDGLSVYGQSIFGKGLIQKSAAVQIESTDKGFLPPRLSSVQRDAMISPVAGLIIFNTTNNKHQGFNGKIWNDLY